MHTCMPLVLLSPAACSSRCPHGGFKSRSAGTAPRKHQTPAFSFLAALAAGAAGTARTGPLMPGEVSLPAPAFLPASENAFVGRLVSSEGIFLQNRPAAANAGVGESWGALPGAASVNPV